MADHPTTQQQALPETGAEQQGAFTQATRESEKIFNSAEQERLEIRTAANRYKRLLATADGLLKGLLEWQRIDTGVLVQLEQDVFDYAHTVRAALLFENLQMARYDSGYYRYHLVNVALMNVLLGRSQNADGSWLKKLVGIGLLSDIGMLLLPSYILEGRQQLSEKDRRAIKAHPSATVELLRESGIHDAATLDAVLHHHERFGGDGYPDGLSGNGISLETRITSVADSFDAALARKAYRNLKSPFDVLAEFAENRFGALDPALTSKAVQIISRMLIGRRVILSDHSVAVVDYIDADNLAYPGVKVLGRYIQTGENLYPVSLTSYMPLK